MRARTSAGWAWISSGTAMSLVGLAACTPSVNAPVTTGIDPAPLPPATVPLAAHWVDSSGATLVGPDVGGGTLVLLGGRRALVDASGVKVESAPAPEAFTDVVAVPVGDRRELVAASIHGLYRLVDPLGTATPIYRGEVGRIGAANGGVYVWSRDEEVPVFIDLSGQGRPSAIAIEEPLVAVAFRDAKNGAAVFAPSGLAITSDGGSTWRLASGTREGAVRVGGLRQSGDGRIRASLFGQGPDGEVDLEHAVLNPVAAPGFDPKVPPLIGWIRATESDPLEVAASSGIEVPGGALIASHGLVAIVDLATGAVSHVIELAHREWLSPVVIGHAGASAFVAGPVAADDSSLFDPFGVMRVRIGAQGFGLDKPLVTRNGDVDLRVSPSGGAMLVGPCSANNNDDTACVKQPGDKWIGVQVDTNTPLAEHGAGPLADGRVAIVRGLSEHDLEPELDPGDIGRGHRLRVAAVDHEGKEATIALVDWEDKPDGLQVLSPIEEDESHALHFVLGYRGGSPHVVVVQPGKEPGVARKLADASVVKLHAGRGFAVGETFQTSLDGGANWSAFELPMRMRLAAAQGSSADAEVSEIGLRFGGALRIGWGPAEPFVELPPVTAPPLPKAPSRKAVRAQVLRCESAGGESQAVPPISSSLHPIGFKESDKPPADVRRDKSWVSSGGSRLMLDTPATLEIDSRIDKASPANKSVPFAWTFRWFDPLAIGARVRTLKIVPPNLKSQIVVGLRSARASDDRAFFTLDIAGSRVLVRVKDGDKPEVLEIPAALAPTPSSDVAFGAGRGAPIAWFHEASLVVWFSGKTPRVVAEVSPGHTRHLGEPTADSIPLLFGGRDWTMTRVIPIGEEAPLRVPLDGWTKLDFPADDPTSLPACGARVKGSRFWLSKSGGSSEIDGATEDLGTRVFDVRVTGGEACVASSTALLSVRHQTDGSLDSPKLGFVRADFVSGRAEGGKLGPPEPAKMTRLRCKLSP